MRFAKERPSEIKKSARPKGPPTVRVAGAANAHPDVVFGEGGSQRDVLGLQGMPGAQSSASVQVRRQESSAQR